MKSGEFLKSLAESPIDQALLEQIGEFGMTTRLVWEHDARLKQFSAAEVVSALRQLTKAKVLEAHPLHHGRYYFTFSKRTAAMATDFEWQGGAFGEHDKVKAFAKLLIGVKYSPGYQPLDTARRRLMLGGQVTGLPDGFLVDKSSNKLLLVRIDASPRAQAVRTAQRLRHDVFRLANTPELKRLVQAKQLELAVAACTQPRCRQIVKLFAAYERVGVVPVRQFALAELAPLFTPVQLGGVFDD